MSVSFKNIIFLLLVFFLQSVLQGYIDISPMIQFCLLPMVIAALPTSWKDISVMIAAFFIGLLADLISGGIPGINAGCCVLVAALRDVVYRRIISTDNRSAATAPTIYTIGKVPYIKFISILTAAYCILFIFLERFSFVPFWSVLLRTITTFVTSTLLIIIFSHFAPQD